MKIKLNKLALEQMDFHPLTEDEEKIAGIESNPIPLGVNPDNPIEMDKRIELSNRVGPIERDSLTEVINEITENDLALDKKKQDISVIDKVNDIESPVEVKRVLEYFNYKYDRKSLTFENFNLNKNEFFNIKEDFNQDVFTTIIADMENMQSVFDCTIDIIKQRTDRVNEVVRKLSVKDLNPEIFDKEYDIGEILSITDTIQQFSRIGNLESMIVTLRDIMNLSTVILTKEDNEIFSKLNSDTESDISSIKNDIKNLIKNDKYTELLNKRLDSKTGARFTLFGRILKSENYEVFDSENMYILKSVQYPDYSDDHYYTFKPELNNLSELLNTIRTELEQFEEKIVEELKIYKEKYKLMTDGVKASLFKLQSPNKELTNTLWESLVYVRVYYITLMHKRLADRLLAHHILLRILSDIF